MALSTVKVTVNAGKPLTLSVAVMVCPALEIVNVRFSLLATPPVAVLSQFSKAVRVAAVNCTSTCDAVPLSAPKLIVNVPDWVNADGVGELPSGKSASSTVAVVELTKTGPSSKKLNLLPIFTSCLAVSPSPSIATARTTTALLAMLRASS